MRVDQRTPCDSHTERCLARASAGSFAEGHAAQILHVGPHAAEAHTIEQFARLLAAHGLERRGGHDETYWATLDAPHANT
jgi:hypothetical protein